MANNSTNIKNPKESLSKRDGQQFLLHQQNKRRFIKERWSSILPISTNQKKVVTVMVNNSTNINKTKESVNSDGQQFLQYQQTKGKF
jgi:lysyl-tRNA synthetase class I